jgi:thioesterase domain-containing protein
MAMRMFARMADQYGVNLPLSLLFTETTIEALAARISEDGKLDESLSVLVPIQPLGSKPPFFCIHGVDGAVLGYRDLVNALGDDRPFLGFQAIGWDDQENFDSTIEAMASRYIDAMRTYQPQGPYRIGGYCFGGVVAYEMACQLEKLGEQVSLLAVFEGAMPEVKETSVSIPYRLSFFLKSIPNWIKDYAGMPPEQLMSRIHTTINRLWGKFLGNPEAQRRARAEEILDTDSNYIPDRNIELTNVNSDAFLMYKPDKYNGTVTVYRARNRSINEVLFGSLDPKMGWDDLAMGGVNVRIVDGFHRNLHLEPYVGSLAADLTQSLEGEQVRRVD